MSRMPAHVLYSFRYVFRAFVFAVAIAIFSLFSPVAHDDPHAVFYTDRAQEQVFFNTLAALNQADFVEPGLNDGTPYNRQRILQERSSTVYFPSIPIPTPSPSANSGTTFVAEKNPIINSTRTNLPSILTRNITLEGNDLWTAYLVYQFALEIATRRSTSELARVFCERGLGRVGCSNIPGLDQKQETDFVTDTNKYISQEDIARAAILASGTAPENKIRQQITDPTATEDTLPATDPANFPRSNSASIAELQQSTASNQTSSGLINGLLTKISAFAPNTALNPFKYVTVKNNSDGEIEVNVPKDITLEDYIDTVGKIASLPSSLGSIAQRAEEQALAFQYYRENPTALADFKLVQDGSGGVRGEITTPASAKIAQIEAGATLAAQASQEQHFASSEVPQDAGDTRIIPIQRIPEVKGATTSADAEITTTPLPSPRVEGVATSLYNLYKAYYDNPPPSTSTPSDNLINPSRESGIFELLQALTNDTYRKQQTTGEKDLTCGFCLQVNQILEDVRSSVGQIYCSLFPTTDLCKSGKDQL